jgi:hypothetical protein
MLIYLVTLGFGALSNWIVSILFCNLHFMVNYWLPAPGLSFRESQTRYLFVFFFCHLVSPHFLSFMLQLAQRISSSKCFIYWRVYQHIYTWFFCLYFLDAHILTCISAQISSLRGILLLFLFSSMFTISWEWIAGTYWIPSISFYFADMYQVIKTGSRISSNIYAKWGMR